MQTQLQKQSKFKSLAFEIRDAERKIVARQRRVSSRAVMLMRQFHQKMTAPGTFILAGGIGFIIGEITKDPSIKVCGSIDKPGVVVVTSPLRTALSLVASVQTLYTALPIAWMLKAYQQRKSKN